MATPKYFGKYRAKVVDINDSEKRGRIRVSCPSVLDEGKSSWCEPCYPFSYDGGGDFYLPKLNDTVWIEFEEGDSNKPIWVGNWFSREKTSLKDDYSKAPNKRIIEFGGAKLVFDDKSNLIIEAGKCKIEMKDGVLKILDSNDSKLEMSSGNIKLNSNKIFLN